MHHRLFGLLTMAALSSACTRSPFELACPDLFRPTVAVRISDFTTGLSAAYRASLVVHGATLYDSLYLDEARGLAPASDSMPPLEMPSQSQVPGTYTVRVHRAGYASWVRNGVAVPAERCGPITVHLDARLQRLP